MDLFRAVKLFLFMAWTMMESSHAHSVELGDGSFIQFWNSRTVPLFHVPQFWEFHNSEVWETREQQVNNYDWI